MNHVSLRKDGKHGRMRKKMSQKIVLNHQPKITKRAYQSNGQVTQNGFRKPDVGDPRRKQSERLITAPTKGHDQLQTKYFCQITDNPVMEVVMELTAVERPRGRRLPLRYVLVIDVSYSMNTFVGSEVYSLMERVKIFAELVVEKTATTDSLAIVSFSDDANVELRMTEMSKDGKKKAKEILQNLETRENTNLEDGLMTALRVIQDSPCYDARDCIIVFTDGKANRGEQDPCAFIKKYKILHDSVQRRSCVPISAFTIGNYHPTLLIELADRLGSEAFYWLNAEEEFEADMLIPIFLRESTQVTDVNIQMQSLLGAEFDLDDVFQQYLVESSKANLRYFIHSVPVLIEKHLPLKIVLPWQRLKSMSGKRILKVECSYLDSAMKQRTIRDFVVLHGKDIAKLQHTFSGSRVKTKFSAERKRLSAFVVIQNKTNFSQKSAMQSFLKIVDENFRRETMLGIEDAKICIENGDEVVAGIALQKAILEVEQLREKYSSMLEGNPSHRKLLNKSAELWNAKLNFACTMTNVIEIGRFYAMQSAIAKEMPTTRGVYESKQKAPHFPIHLTKKLKHYEKKVQGKKKMKEITFQPASIFEGMKILLSESLRGKTFGVKQDTLADLIARCGGRVDFYVDICPYGSDPAIVVEKKYENTILLCAQIDYRKQTKIVKDSEAANIPIVRERFIYGCFKEKRLLDIEKFLMAT